MGAVVGLVGRSFVSIGMDFDPCSVKYNFYSFRLFLCRHTDMGIGESQLSENLSFPISKFKYNRHIKLPIIFIIPYLNSKNNRL